MDIKPNSNLPERVLSLTPVIVGLALQFAFFIFHLIIGGWTKSQALELNSHYLLLSMGFWGLALFHSFFKKKANEEKNELLRVEKLRLERGAKSALFQNNEIVSGSFQQNLIKFEKYFLPIACFIFSALLMAYGYQLYREYKAITMADSPINIFKACAFIASISFLMLIAGLYIRGLAKGDYGYLRGPATIMLTASALSLVESGFLIALTSKWLDNLNLLYLLGGLLSFLVGFELLLNTFLYLMKPVHQEETKIPPYDSRVFLLLTSTGSAWKSVNGMIDYQFGFSISESWLYKTFLKLILPFIALQFLAGVLCTSFVIIPSGQLGVLERFGQPLNQGAGLEPGLHFKMPWPIDEVIKVNVGQITTVVAGHKEDDHDLIDPKQLGTLDHYAETDLFVIKKKSPTNKENYLELISISAIFHYQPNPDHLIEYLYQYHSIDESIQMLIHSELSAFLSEKVVVGTLGEQIPGWNTEFKLRFYEKIKQEIPGIKPVFLSLLHIQVPAELSDSVNEIFIASEKKKVNVFQSEAESIKLETQTVQEVIAIQSEQKQAIYKTAMEANEETRRIKNLGEVFKKFGVVFKQREWLEAIEKVFAEANIDFVSAKIKINLEDGSKGKDPLENFVEQ